MTCYMMGVANLFLYSILACESWPPFFFKNPRVIFEDLWPWGVHELVGVSASEQPDPI